MDLDQRINDLWDQIDEIERLGYKDQAELIKHELFIILEAMPKNEIIVRTLQ